MEYQRLHNSNGPAAAIADGILLEPNAYDNQIYAYSMGPTKITIAAPSLGVTTTTPITITGSIIDISPGADKLSVAKNFPNGLPCVSDASMTRFMEAVYSSNQCQPTLTGVPVTLMFLTQTATTEQLEQQQAMPMEHSA